MSLALEIYLPVKKKQYLSAKCSKALLVKNDDEGVVVLLKCVVIR